MLNFTEADLFMRAGQDVRRKVMPIGDFVRRVDDRQEAPEVGGYVKSQWTPTQQDEDATDWRVLQCCMQLECSVQ